MMKKYILVCVIILLIISCNQKTEFVQSKVMPYVFLIKNIKKDSLLKKEIISFLSKNPEEYNKKPFQINFYRYSSNTSYFINNLPDPGGFSSEELSNYPEDKLAFYIITKCKNDTLKKVGELYFYTDDFYKPDTIIYKCN